MTTPQDGESHPISVTGRQGRYEWVPGQESQPELQEAGAAAVPGSGPEPSGASWAADPSDPTGVRYWDGANWTSWTAQRRRPPPTRALAVPLVALSGVGIATAWTMWPSAIGGGQAWCSYAESNASGWATLALWAVGVALALVTFFWWRRDGYTPCAWPVGMLIGALVLPLALGALGWNSCWA